MKHINLAATIAAAVALAMGAPAAFAATSTGQSAAETVTFSGAVQSDTCTVSIGGGAAKAANAAQSATITMPTVTSSAFGSITVGAVAGASPFTVVLAGCPSSVANVAATWTAAATDTSGNLYDSSKTANSSVGVQLLDSAGGVMNVSSPLTQPAVAVAGGAATLNYTAQYVAEAAPATFKPGTVSEVATLVLSYQ